MWCNGIITHCVLDSGILLSNLVLHRIASKLDWCIKNAFLDSDDVNVGRCIFYATGIGCSNMVQGLNFKGFMFNATTRDLDFDKLEGIKEFNSALTFWPVNNADMLLKLHAYFAKVGLIF